MSIVSSVIKCNRKNVDKTKRNGAQEESRTVIKYITNMGKDGVSGQDAFNVYISPQTYTFAGGAASAQPGSARISVHAFRGQTALDTSIGQITGLIPNALDASVHDNRTIQTYIDVTVTNLLTSNSGELTIPVYYLVDQPDGSTAIDSSAWDASIGYTEAHTDLLFSWTVTKSGGDTYTLDLTNETAMINCNADGSILTDATRPTCKANLYFGTSLVSGATYAISTPVSANAQGVSINSYSGEMTFNSGRATTPFSFSGTTLSITVTATPPDASALIKIMTVNKNYPGADGFAVTHWIKTSTSRIKYDPNTNTYSPSTVSAECWKQVNEDEPERDYSTRIWYGWDTETPSSSYSTAINTSNAAGHSSLVFGLQNSSNEFYELETVPIIADGKNGTDGSAGQGRAGAAIRGPYEFVLSEERRYCSGNGNTASGVTEEDEDFLWIDVMFRIENGQKKYYYCSTTYEATGSQTWNQVKDYWTASAEQYDFVAAHLILADYASIDFMTNNELYLKYKVNGVDTITAGAAGGTGISFWAGASNPSSAPFRVNYEGILTATKGQFGCLSIGTDASRNNQSVLQGSVSENDYVHSLVLDPEGFSMTGILRDWQDTYNIESESLIIRPLRDADRFDDGGSGAINIHYDYNDPSMSAQLSDSSLYLYYRSFANLKYALNTNESVYSGRYVQDTWNIANGTGSSGVVTTPGLFGLEVVFVTANDSSDLFTKDTLTGHWLFAGMDTGFEYGNAGTSKLARIGEIVGTNPSTGSGETFVKTTSPRTHYTTSDPEWGHWVFYYSQYGFYESGVISETSQRLPNVIYIKV